MNINEIKKALYKENPRAILMLIRDQMCSYETLLKDGTVIPFEVPMIETKGADFFSKMDAKYLIRWINYKK